MVVQRGRELPSILDGDAAGTDGGNVDTDGLEDGTVTLDDSALWIIDKPVLIAAGTTLKVTKGAQLQFWSSLPDETYTIWRNSYMQVEGNLAIQGTPESPVRLFPSTLYSTRGVGLKTNDAGSISLSYSHITNFVGSGSISANYNIFDRTYNETRINYKEGAKSASDLTCCQYNVSIPGSGTGNRFYKLSYLTQLQEDTKAWWVVSAFQVTTICL